MNGQHSRALDGLRWFSFLGVFLYHADQSVFRFGRYGVQLFFVLSGFLIGNILLSLREQTQTPLFERLKTFYIRRSLRIFPLYYFVLLMIAVLGSLHVINGHLHVLPYHALYLSNFYLAITGARIDSQTHLWSLCVEEHFYLIAPLLLLRVGYRQLAIGFVWLFLLVAIARICNFLFWGNPRFEYFSPIQFDILVAGIVTALVMRRGSFMALDAENLKKLGFICGVACAGILVWMYFPSRAEIFVESVIFPPILAVAMSAALLTLWTGGLGVVRQVCSWSPFVYLGRISYGLYIYHYLILHAFWQYSTGLERFLRVTACLLATIVIASLSWYFLEKPFLNLKRRFDYHADGRARPPCARLESNGVPRTEQVAN
jgi:peptidoglycan/LPS O-acetylase OafA/YrhL